MPNCAERDDRQLTVNGIAARSSDSFVGLLGEKTTTPTTLRESPGALVSVGADVDAAVRTLWIVASSVFYNADSMVKTESWRSTMTARPPHWTRPWRAR